MRRSRTAFTVLALLAAVMFFAVWSLDDEETTQVVTEAGGAERDLVLAFTDPTGIGLATTDGGESSHLTIGRDVAWSPDGSRIAFHRDPGVHVIDADGTNERFLAHGSDPAWSPDGSRIAYIRGPELLVVPSGGGPPRVLAPVWGDEAPAWSPDGDRLVLATPDGLVLADLDGGHRLLHQGLVSHAGWSPDGSLIAYSHGQEQTALYVIQPDPPGRPRRLTPPSGGFDTEHELRMGAWSPDGSRIAYFRGPDLRVLTLSGHDVLLHRRTDTPVNMGLNHVSWSPRGTLLAYQVFDAIYVVGADGSAPRPLLDADGGTYEPEFQPSAIAS